MVTGMGLESTVLEVFARSMDVRLKRAYDDADESDGFRVLVDRLWPRGVSKQNAAIDLWAKECAPSTELRHEWHAAESDAAYAACANRYRAELSGESTEALAELANQIRGKKTVTLVYAVRDAEHNHARVLAEMLGPLLRAKA